MAGPILGWADRKGGTNDCADEVTLSLKGAKSPTRGRKLRSTGTKARVRVGRNRKSREDLEMKLAEALEQQTATSEVLQVISSSPGELEPVFQAMLANATRICDAKFGMLLRYDGDAFHPAATLNLPPALADFLRLRGPWRPEPGTSLYRLLQTKEASHTIDQATEPVQAPSAKLAGARSHISVPMLKEGNIVGAIAIYRQEVRPFTKSRSS